MNLTITVDTGEPDRHLDRLGRWDARAVAGFEATLVGQYNHTQAIVHVDTDSLRRSGQLNSRLTRRNRQWEGTIAYGGKSVGSVYPLVDYARVELDRDGSHDFLTPITPYGSEDGREFHHRYVRAVIAHFKGA